MRELIEKLISSTVANRPVAYCRLVETRGSTPQKAGAMMLVFADGSQAGTLGGGCVEAEVKRQAIAVLNAGDARIARFDLDHDYGWDDGLICGGRMLINIDPVRPGDAICYFQHLLAEFDGANGATEVFVYDHAKIGLPEAASFLVDGERNLLASRHAESVELPATIASALQPIESRPRPYAGGGLSFIPIHPRCSLLIVGAGHVGKAVCELAASVDFDVCIVDDRDEFVSAERFPHAMQRVSGDFEKVLPEIEIDADTFCLIVTRGHNHDQRALFHLVDKGAGYVGMIGSRRKIKMIFEDLTAEGVSAEALENVHAPVGIDIGSQTVAEIAISIVSELIAFRNRSGFVPGRPDRVACS